MTVTPTIVLRTWFSPIHRTVSGDSLATEMYTTMCFRRVTYWMWWHSSQHIWNTVPMATSFVLTTGFWYGRALSYLQRTTITSNGDDISSEAKKSEQIELEVGQFALNPARDTSASKKNSIFKGDVMPVFYIRKTEFHAGDPRTKMLAHIKRVKIIHHFCLKGL